MDDVPRLSVTTPSRTLPVPIAPIMLSPPPAATRHSRCHAELRGDCRTQLADNALRAEQRRQCSKSWPVPPSIASSISRVQARVRTSKKAVPEASPNSARQLCR